MRVYNGKFPRTLNEAFGPYETWDQPRRVPVSSVLCWLAIELLACLAVLIQVTA